MLHRIKVISLDVAAAPSTVSVLEGFQAVQFLFRLHGSVVGASTIPVTNGAVSSAAIGRALLQEHALDLARCAFKQALTETGASDYLEKMSTPPPAPGDLPFITVAVCTHDRTADLERCLLSLSKIDYPQFEVVVVDNAPATNATKHLIREKHPSFCYVRELRPGLGNARNRAAREAHGDIVAFTDDDAEADPFWLRALGRLFSENPQAMAATGLVMPAELETDAQQLFAWTGGVNRGFQRRWVFAPSGENFPWRLFDTGRLGTGTNMAFRRILFDEIGEFDPALGPGTCTMGGDDSEFFLRTLKAGHLLVYEPDAVVWHRHPRDLAGLEQQLRSHGSGFGAYLSRTYQAYPHDRKALRRLVRWSLFSRYLPPIAFGFYRPMRVPLRLYLGELSGFLSGFSKYRRACRTAGRPLPRPAPVPESPTDHGHPICIRYVDLLKPLEPLLDLDQYDLVEVRFLAGEKLLGKATIANAGKPVGVSRLADEAQPFYLGDRSDSTAVRGLPLSAARAISHLQRLYLPQPDSPSNSLPSNIPVSIVIATRDRPDELRRCLRSLAAQKTSRPLEILVVDNSPGSSHTERVMTDFPKVRFLQESRRGPSYARNAGIRAASGQIIVSTDDDIWAPPDWIEKLVAPFARADVAAVAGHVLAASLEAPSEQLFESYGGLGRGFVRREFGRAWFESFKKHATPVWNIGGTANAAFRASIFRDPAIGFFDEALGPGTPTGVGEDTYLFYKILKTGHTIVYEPDAWLHHHHRCTTEGLQKQISNYSKGHVAYQLTTWMKDGDWRALYQLAILLPYYWILEFLKWGSARDRSRLSFLKLQITGAVLGPFALWQSRWEVKRLNRRTPPEAAQQPELSKAEEAG